MDLTDKYLNDEFTVRDGKKVTTVRISKDGRQRVEFHGDMVSIWSGRNEVMLDKKGVATLVKILKNWGYVK